MYVIKRDGRKENSNFHKIQSRIERICSDHSLQFIDSTDITAKVNQGIYDGVPTAEVDNLIAETSASLATVHPDYDTLAARVTISKMHKETPNRFSLAMTQLYHFNGPESNKHKPMISEFHYKIIMENADRLDSAINYERDLNFNYFGFKTLETSYLLKINEKLAERPQHMLMRVAVGIHGRDIDAAIQTYDLMSLRYFTHASPTLFNSCMPKAQLSSCFLLTMKEDSLEAIYDSVKQCAIISKYSGGIGVNIHCIRGKHSYIGGINSTSSGIVPMLKLFSSTAKFVNQRGRRPGAIAVYLEPWHVDIFDFLDIRKNTGTEENRARDLFTALWIPDLFMERVLEDGDWCLMCPNSSPGLEDSWGDEFKRLYTSYELKGQFFKKVKARDLFHAIYVAQVETGTPFMLYKDACNRKSNQQNLGTIKSSNLCTEIIEYSSSDEIGVCNLASIAVNMFVGNNGTYDFQKLKEVTKTVTRNLNKIIDLNYYPLPEAERSNKRHRPIGIGVQGLADTFILMRFPYDSPQAKKLNIQIFETLYYGALEASCELAKELGTYETYAGSPISKGVLQYDMWNVTPTDLWDWSDLKKRIANYGVRNSLLIALMPTASTAQILGNTECIEPYTSNMFCRRVSSGEFQVVNRHLTHDLIERGLWNQELKNSIIADGGSIQNIDVIPKDLKLLYRTVWEIPIKSILEMAADRGAFIDQSQSLNVFIANPTYQHLTTIHIYGWKLGLKTGMYYLRTKPAAQANQFTVDKTKLSKIASKENNQICTPDGKGICQACSC